MASGFRRKPMTTELKLRMAGEWAAHEETWWACRCTCLWGPRTIKFLTWGKLNGLGGCSELKQSQNWQDEAVQVCIKTISDSQALLGHLSRTWVAITHAFTGAGCWECGLEIAAGKYVEYGFELALWDDEVILVKVLSGLCLGRRLEKGAPLH